MRVNLTRYRKVAALGEEPTPTRRALAAAVAGSVAFMLVHLLLGVAFGFGSGAVLFSGTGCAVAAAFAAVTLKHGMAVVYGLLAAIWLLAECLVAVLGVIAACLG